jgi:hypothetical protein
LYGYFAIGLEAILPRAARSLRHLMSRGKLVLSVPGNTGASANIPADVEKHPLADANLIVNTAVGKAQEPTSKSCVAVCNQLGGLIALNRMDGAFEYSSRAATALVSVDTACQAARSPARSTIPPLLPRSERYATYPCLERAADSNRRRQWSRWSVFQRAR